MTLVNIRLRPIPYTLAVAGLCFLGLMGACQSKQEKVESQRGELREEKEDVAEAQRDAQSNIAEEQREVQEAAQELNDAQRQARAEWQQDYLAFKREMLTELTDNEKLVLEKRGKIAALDAQAQAQYNTAISDAEQRNNELRERLNNATDQGDEAWTAFKDDFRKSVNAIEDAIKGINV